MSVTVYCTRIIALAPVTPGDSIFAMTIGDCSTVFTKLGGEKTNYIREQSTTTNGKIYLKTHL